MTTIIGILSAVALVLMATFILFLLRRHKYYKNEEDPKAVSLSVKPSSSHNQQFHEKYIKGKLTINLQIVNQLLKKKIAQLIEFGP